MVVCCRTGSTFKIDEKIPIFYHEKRQVFATLNQILIILVYTLHQLKMQQYAN